MKFLPIAIALLTSIALHAQPPTAEDDKAIAGSWRVEPPRVSRMYEITEGRTIKISGSNMKDKRDRLIPQDDGSYHVYLDKGVLRIYFKKEQDRLLVEWFGDRADIKKGLTPMWKSPGVRLER